MNREDIIRMAREAGLAIKSPSWGYTEHYHFAGFEQTFERFAALVAASAKAEENEACAKVAECFEPTEKLDYVSYASRAIRARKENT